MIKSYYKSVCDRILGIIVLSGKTCTIEVLSDEGYFRLLDEKMNEK